MTTNLYHLVLLLTAASLCDSDTNSDLLSVVVIYRHGDRTPVEPYPKDPYKDPSLWPVGFGQLTNLGKLHQYKHGIWLRQRYASFLSANYSEKEIYIRSTDVDRTLMSAEVNTAGLYPPNGQQIWDPDLRWQPVPVHTVPEAEDNLLAMKKPCARYASLFAQKMNSPEMKALNSKLAPLYAYLTENSGRSVSSVRDLDYLYNTLLIEAQNNFTLPEWTRKVYPAMEPFACLSFAMECNDTALARLKTGPFFHLLREHFGRTVRNETAPKFWVFSAHDTTVANLLNSMGLFEVHCPPYMSTVIFELRRSDGRDVLNVFYKNSTEPMRMVLPGCEFDCPLDDFRRIVAPIAVSDEDWNVECNLLLRGFVDWERPKDVMLVCILGVVLSCVAGGLLVFFCRRRNRNDEYLRLPNKDVIF